MNAMCDCVDALERGDPATRQDAAAGALADGANKNVEIDTGVVDAVNRAVNGKSEGFDHTDEPVDPIHEADSGVADGINPPPLQ